MKGKRDDTFDTFIYGMALSLSPSPPSSRAGLLVQRGLLRHVAQLPVRAGQGEQPRSCLAGAPCRPPLPLHPGLLFLLLPLPPLQPLEARLRRRGSLLHERPRLLRPQQRVHWLRQCQRRGVRLRRVAARRRARLRRGQLRVDGWVRWRVGGEGRGSLSDLRASPCPSPPLPRWQALTTRASLPP